MHRRIFYLGLICFLLTILAFTKQSAFAGSGPPPTPNPNRSPWITGQNADVVTNAGSERALEPAGVLVDSPSLFGLAFQENAAAAGELVQLAVPQRYQNPADPTCGAAALGMALDFLSLSEGGEVPDTNTLVQDLDASGFYYETGTGVEELAYIARSYGYRGSSPFHGWTLEDLAGELAAGRPVVVTLGKNGANQPGHFVTITGMSADGSWVRYNDPVLGQQTVSSEDFFEAWGSQGYSGLTIKKGELAAVSDPLLPWMGLLGSVSALAVLTRVYPHQSRFKYLLSALQGSLGNPRRMGLGGKLEPVYEWKQVQDGTKAVTDKNTKIYDYRDRWVQKGWKTVQDTSKKIYEYGTRWVQSGWKTVKDYSKKIYEYGTRWVQKGWKKVTSWVKGIWGWFKKTKWVPKKVKEKFVKGWHYGTKKVPKMVKETFVKGWHYATKTAPNMVKETLLKGWHYATKTVPNFIWKKVQVGWQDVGEVLQENSTTPEPFQTPIVLPTPARPPTPTPHPPSGDPPGNPTGTPCPVQPPETSNPTIDQRVSEPSIWQKLSNPHWWQSKIKEIAGSINNQSIYSLSASDKWDINIYSQAGVIAQTSPYNMVYLNQRLNLGDKVKVTGNPGSLFDIDVTSETATLNITKNLNIFGSANGGAFGISQKRPGEMGHDYMVDKYSLGWGQYGLTLTYQQEGVDVVMDSEKGNYTVKNIAFMACETNTLRTKGLVLIGGAIVLVGILGPEILPLLGLPELAKNIPAFGY